MLDYTYTDELYHYGVLGMKWGVRRARRADANIRSTEHARKLNKMNQDFRVHEAKIKRSESGNRFGKIKDKALARKIKMYEKEYDNTEAINKYSIAKSKAVKDPSYKNSSEFKTLRHDANVVTGKAFLAAAGIYAASFALTAATSR